MTNTTKRCEETVERDGCPTACDRPVDAHGYCDRASDHVWELGR